MDHKGDTTIQERQRIVAKRPVMKKDEAWRKWVEVKVKVSGLPIGTTTLELSRAFHQKGHISRIEVSDRCNGVDTEAYVVFSPVPVEAFWEAASFQFPVRNLDSYCPVLLELQDQQRSFFRRSPVNPRYSYPERITLNAESLNFGIMFSESSMMVMETIQTQRGSRIQFMLNLLYRELEIQFSISNRRASTSGSLARRYRIRLPLTKLDRVYSHDMENEASALLIPLDDPPEVYLQTEDIEGTHDDQTALWSESRTWYRQTHIGEDPEHLQKYPIRLGKCCAAIDIGSWTTYRLVFDRKKVKAVLFDVMLNALRDYNVATISDKEMAISLRPRQDSQLWSLLDLPEKHFSDPMGKTTGLQEMGSEIRYLSFPVCYQLEVCISQGRINEHNVGEEFIRQLAARDDQTAIQLLERVADMKNRLYDPMSVFEIPIPRASGRNRVPDYSFECRTATVTPTRIYFSTPAVEITNRVIRRFWEHNDRFLRVKFSDEINNGRINSVDDDTRDEIFERVKRTMCNGIVVGDRKFEFVAFGNSQFREHGAFFFASTGEVTAADIRNWMGWDEIKEIKNVAKRSARLGQCFSTTRAINTGDLNIEYIADVKSQCGTYCFTDGVGKISPLVASLIVAELGVPTAHNDLPSVFQFRYGGAKGVLALDPHITGKTLCLRQSQSKFESRHKTLEVIRVSQFAAATTNRQLIILLSSLGVPDEVFRGKLNSQLEEINCAMRDEKCAVQLLQRNIDSNQMTLTLARVINEGFMKAQDPFVMSMLHLWRSWSVKYLKEKAKLFTDKGACLLGCIDEFGVLEGHYNAIQPNPMASREVKESTLPEVFVRVGTGNGNYNVIEGLCVLCRNPSLHPGDIRVVRAVDKPELYHLKNVVVFPRQGDRDLSSMCSGGDLDGDDYLIIWDPELLPAISHWNHDPMDFRPTVASQFPSKEPTVDDMIEFFVTYMRNDRLPRIAHSHLALADFSPWGVNDHRCLELAQLHSEAVDYPKSGVAVKMKRSLYARKWPHFMEKKHKPAEAIYKSQKILGQLYDMVETITFSPRIETPFDARILSAYNLEEDILQKAKEIKAEYDAAIKRIMAQHAIATEFEVWSTFCLSHNFDKKDFTFAEELGRTTSAVKDRFRKVCITQAGGRDFEHLAPFVAAMYEITAREVTEAINTQKGTDNTADKGSIVLPFISFPWIFHSELGKIANGSASRKDVNGSGLESFDEKFRPSTDAQLGKDANATSEETVKADIKDTIREDVKRCNKRDNENSDERHVKMIEAGITGCGIKGSTRVHPLDMLTSVLPKSGIDSHMPGEPTERKEQKEVVDDNAPHALTQEVNVEIENGLDEAGGLDSCMLQLQPGDALSALDRLAALLRQDS